MQLPAEGIKAVLVVADQINPSPSDRTVVVLSIGPNVDRRCVHEVIDDWFVLILIALIGIRNPKRNRTKS